MTLTAEEVLDLADEVHVLGQVVKDARDVSSEGGRRLSRGERRDIAMRAAKLALRLVIDLLD